LSLSSTQKIKPVPLHRSGDTGFEFIVFLTLID
jgi:hypothetical protein